MKDTFVIGVIVSSHGIEGTMKIKSLSGETGHFHRLKEVNLVREGRNVRLAVKEVKDFGAGNNPSGAFVLMKFEGVSSPEEGMKYAGWEILADRKDAAPLREGEYYINELTGCSLIMDGVVAGVVEGIYDSSPADLLEIRKTDGRVVMVPFIDKFIGSVETAKRVIELKEEWILE